MLDAGAKFIVVFVPSVKFPEKEVVVLLSPMAPLPSVSSTPLAIWVFPIKTKSPDPLLITFLDVCRSAKV